MHWISEHLAVFSSSWLSFPKVIGITTSNRIWLREKSESLFVAVGEGVLECHITHVLFHWVIQLHGDFLQMRAGSFVGRSSGF